MGAPRHLSLLPKTGRAERLVWPVPFADGVPMMIERRGERVVMLASGDPFWFGAGSVVTRHLAPGEWVAYPAPSTLSLAAARLGWPVETIHSVGLHARPLETLRPHLAPGRRILALMRDGASVTGLAAWLSERGFGDSALTVLEALGGPRERVRHGTAAALDWTDIAHPVAVAIEPAGEGRVLPSVSGLDDDWFPHDGQITKRPARELARAQPAPRPGDALRDIQRPTPSVLSVTPTVWRAPPTMPRGWAWRGWNWSRAMRWPNSPTDRSPMRCSSGEDCRAPWSRHCGRFLIVAWWRMP